LPRCAAERCGYFSFDASPNDPKNLGAFPSRRCRRRVTVYGSGMAALGSRYNVTPSLPAWGQLDERQ